MLVATLDPQWTEDLAGAMCRLLSRRQQFGCLPIEANMHVGLIGVGSPTHLAAQQALLDMYLVKKANRRQPQMVPGPMKVPASWLAAEHRHLLERLLRASGLPQALVAPALSTSLTADMAENLQSLRAVALEHDKLLVLVGSVASCDELVVLASAADEVLLCKECEPDPPYHCAASIEVLSCEGYFPDGRGAALMQIKREASRVVLACEPFIAPNAVDRFIWYLGASEVSRSMIADAVDLSIEEVDSRLRSLRLVRRSHVPDDLNTRFGTRFRVPGPMDF